MAIPGRAPGCPKVPGSGRKAGTPAKTRTEITDAMRRDILAVYKKLGGTKWLAEFAKVEPGVFVREVLARILPPVPREEPMVAVQVNNNVDQLSDHEAAVRIAFLLNASAYEQGLIQPPVTSPRVIEPEPAAAPEAPTLPPSAPPMEDLPPTGFTYAGSAREQGREPVRKNVITKGRRNLL